MVGLWFLQRFGWCLVVLAASWLACSPLGLFLCSRCWRILMSSMWSSRSVLGVDMAILLDVVVRVL